MDIGLMAISALLIAGFLVGIRLMQSPRTALWGNRLGAVCMAVAILFGLGQWRIFGNYGAWLAIVAGGVVGVVFAQRVTMIQMPPTVALLNGLGGAASALVVASSATIYGGTGTMLFWLTAVLALATGVFTFSGSVMAVVKLQNWISPRSVYLVRHQIWSSVLLIAGLLMGLICVISPVVYSPLFMPLIVVVFAVHALLTTIRVGGADMPVIISFLNSLSGIAAAFSGLAVGDLLLTGVGAIVGVAGMILTQLMCRAMNRNLPAVLGGFQVSSAAAPECHDESKHAKEEPSLTPEERLTLFTQNADNAIIVPGYGMALAQAQQEVKNLIDALEARGKEVKIAVHPVAGRMPGHMNVLLAEVGISYDKIFDMETINPDFAKTDLVVAVGACDVINPAANTAEGTPIYGMPILKAKEAKNVIVCNLNEKPGYSGVENPLYDEDHVLTLWGNAKGTVPRITESLQSN